MSAFDPYNTDLMITVQLRKHCDINENRLFFFTRSLSPLLPQSSEWVGTGVDRIRPCDQSERGGDNEDRRVKDYTHHSGNLRLTAVIISELSVTHTHLRKWLKPVLLEGKRKLSFSSGVISLGLRCVTWQASRRRGGGGGRRSLKSDLGVSQ